MIPVGPSYHRDGLEQGAEALAAQDKLAERGSGDLRQHRAAGHWVLDPAADRHAGQVLDAVPQRNQVGVALGDRQRAALLGAECQFNSHFSPRFSRR